MFMGSVVICNDMKFFALCPLEFAYSQSLRNQDHWPDYEFVTSYEFGVLLEDEDPSNWMVDDEGPDLLVTGEVGGHGDALALTETLNPVNDDADEAEVDVLLAAGAGNVGDIERQDHAYIVSNLGGWPELAGWSGGAQGMDTLNAGGKQLFYVAYGDAGFIKLNWTDPALAVLEQHLNTVGDALDVTVVNGRAYVADSGGGIALVK